MGFGMDFEPMPPSNALFWMAADLCMAASCSHGGRFGLERPETTGSRS